MSKEPKIDPNWDGAHKTILRLVGRNKNVLDVGCGVGALAREMRKNGCNIVGIEVDPVAADNAQVFCKDVIIKDIESLEKITYNSNYFDVILFADVLEHLREPLIVLKRLKKYLSEDGVIIYTVPNIAHWSIRLRLLFGKFEYRPEGIISYNHLRFFTLKSAKILLEESGYKVTKIDCTSYFPLFFLKKYEVFQRIRYLMTKICKSLFAYQLVLVGKKR